jgi:hypothetical protein
VTPLWLRANQWATFSSAPKSSRARSASSGSSSRKRRQAANATHTLDAHAELTTRKLRAVLANALQRPNGGCEQVARLRGSRPAVRVHCRAAAPTISPHGAVVVSGSERYASPTSQVTMKAWCHPKAGSLEIFSGNVERFPLRGSTDRERSKQLLATRAVANRTNHLVP